MNAPTTRYLTEEELTMLTLEAEASGMVAAPDWEVLKTFKSPVTGKKLHHLEHVSGYQTYAPANRCLVGGRRPIKHLFIDAWLYEAKVRELNN